MTSPATLRPLSTWALSRCRGKPQPATRPCIWAQPSPLLIRTTDLMVVRVRQFDDRDVGVALVEHAGHDEMPAEPPPTIAVWCFAGSRWFVRSGVLGRVVPGAVAAQDVAHVGESAVPQQACRDRRP